MIIVIDGYNFLKTVLQVNFVRQDQLQQWVQRFQEYAHYRSNSVVLVFDAGPDLHPTQDGLGAVTILYAGQYQSADSLIASWLLRHKNQDLLLVTSDREVRDNAARLNVVSINSADFYKVFMTVLGHEQDRQHQYHATIYKTAQDTNAGQQELVDMLMEQGSRNLVHENIKTEYNSDIIRIRDGKKVSKTDKAVIKQVRKI